MEQLLKEIRNAFHMSQERFAALVGSTFATVNRWENGRSTPGKMAQERIMGLCQEHGIPLHDLVMEHILRQAEIPNAQGRLILYHGSKSGLSGPIAPISRDKCDFGKGFYMGTDLAQPLTLVCDFEQSRFYVISLDLQGLSVLEVPPDLDWAMLVAYHRGKMDVVCDTPLYERYAQMVQGQDILVGPIANDRMFFVLDNFFQGNITDVALVQSLAALQLGRQYVAVTKRACGQVRVEKEIPLSHLERSCLRDISEQNRAKGISLANEICRSHRRDGRYFDEILDGAKEGA